MEATGMFGPSNERDIEFTALEGSLSMMSKGTPLVPLFAVFAFAFSFPPFPLTFSFGFLVPSAVKPTRSSAQVGSLPVLNSS